MLKIERISYKGIGSKRLFYIAENEIHDSVKAHVYTSGDGRKEEEFSHLEFEVWDLEFIFNYPGKYIFIIFEDGLRNLIVIATII